MSLRARAMRSLGRRPWFAAAGRRFGASLDKVLYRLTRGRFATTVGVVPTMLLTTTGRRTGRARTTPVMYVPDGDRYVVSSENFGQQRPAAWPLNLAANPEATVQVGAEVFRCQARRLDDEEADHYWPRLVEAWPAHEAYRARSGTRHMFVLEPVRRK
jgi:deazaflavin-dependent oxidoreductase (nitroreductase family)